MKTLNEQLEIAIELAIKHHRGQIDKGGNPYILHSLEVMNNVDRMESKIVAVLHDIIEDTECTVDTLREWGIDEDAIESINALTHKEGMPYMEYITEISYDLIATEVKLADLKCNMDLSRLNRKITNKDLERNKKYMKAYYFLLNKI